MTMHSFSKPILNPTNIKEVRYPILSISQNPSKGKKSLEHIKSRENRKARNNHRKKELKRKN